MTRIAIVGAGGYEFPLTLVSDFLSYDSMRDAQIVLMDPDPSALARVERLARQIVGAHRLPATVVATTELAPALTGADFVVTCFQVGGREAYALDVEIPRRYGVDQTVGDTLGPGGVFRGLRSMRALEDITAGMRAHCPDALLMNYTNPMSINTGFAASMGVRTIGICHSVHHTTQALAAILGLEPGTWSFRAAGINHQAWVIEFRHRGRDVMPQLRAAVREYNQGRREPNVPADEWDALYMGNREEVRTQIMDLVGYFQTESSHHASEYYPHFRRSPAATARVLPDRWDYLAITSLGTDADQQRLADELSSRPLVASEEQAAVIANAMLTGVPAVVYGNVPNTGLITNLPGGACVEVPVLVDGSGIQPTVVGDLPTTAASQNLASIGLQLCTLEAYRTGSRDPVYAAVALDRLTGALLSLVEIRAMVDEMFEAERRWLPDLR